MRHKPPDLSRLCFDFLKSRQTLFEDHDAGVKPMSLIASSASARRFSMERRYVSLGFLPSGRLGPNICLMVIGILWLAPADGAGKIGLILRYQNVSFRLGGRVEVSLLPPELGQCSLQHPFHKAVDPPLYDCLPLWSIESKGQLQR